MYKKTLVVAMTALLCAAAAFAQEESFEQQQVPQQQQEAKVTSNIKIYGKLSVSKENRTDDSWSASIDLGDGSSSMDVDAKSKLTVITPTFGAVGKRFAFEFGLGLGVGETGGPSLPDSDNYSSSEQKAVFESLSGAAILAIIPRADLVWHLRDLDSFFVPFAHFGIGVPIQVAWTGVDEVGLSAVSFELSTGLGLLFNVTEHVGLLMDTRFSFGPSNGFAVSVGTRFK